MIILSVISLSSCNKSCKDLPLPPDETTNNQTTTTSQTTTTTTSQTTTTAFSTEEIKEIVEEDLQIKLPVDTNNLFFKKTYYSKEEYKNIWGYVAKFSLSEEGYNKLSKSFNTPFSKGDEFSYNYTKDKYKMCFDADFEDIEFAKRCFASARLTETIYVKTTERKGWLAKNDDKYTLYVHCRISKKGEYQEKKTVPKATTTTEPTIQYPTWRAEVNAEYIKQDFGISLSKGINGLYKQISFKGNTNKKFWGYIASAIITEKEFNEISKTFSTDIEKSKEIYNNLKKEYFECFAAKFSDISYYKLQNVSSYIDSGTNKPLMVAGHCWLAKRKNEYMLYAYSPLSKASQS